MATGKLVWVTINSTTLLYSMPNFYGTQIPNLALHNMSASAAPKLFSSHRLMAVTISLASVGPSIDTVS